jgi:transcriptional regulator with XRE-family HTH domain
MKCVAVKRQVGLAIRQLRLERGLSQAALAKRTGANRTFLAGVETGTRNLTLQTMSRLAEALGVGVDEFFKMANKNKPATASGPRS